MRHYEENNCPGLEVLRALYCVLHHSSDPCMRIYIYIVCAQFPIQYPGHQVNINHFQLSS